MEILTGWSLVLVGAKTAATAISRTFTNSSKGSLGPQPESDGKSADVGGGGHNGILILKARPTLENRAQIQKSLTTQQRKASHCSQVKLILFVRTSNKL